ncbi:hypothetical protein MS3_00003136 [Schistosoma haematobium]|uniref:Uncharacterized protein n=1 Tax=Schistosoma haematobium TaxID=6185 RepID=A0A094ZTS7_SCHHA|nr:hypothetical protein MS3_00003136 [Schistosoma haematobium]KAH9590465.1 hypothetical protein MS3_00003136 [Schistosoma haematobium]
MTNLPHSRGTYSFESQKSEINKRKKNFDDGSICFGPLHRYVHLNDAANSQIFTFLLLPHLLCGLVNYVETQVFQYAEHEWFVRFERTDTHLGFYLELITQKSENCETMFITSSQIPISKSDHNVTKRPTQWKTITLDFEFTIKNRNVFSQNECFFKSNCTFTQDSCRHGRKNVIDLSTLSSKRFLFDDGKCIIELGLRNPHICIKLQANQVEDPTNHLLLKKDRKRTHNNGSVVLRRMDNETITFPDTIHFETDHFSYADDTWVLTIDIEPYRDLLRNLTFDSDNNHDVCADVEICLTKKSEHKTDNYTYYNAEKPLGTQWTRLLCNAYLPGECHTGLMQFLIGSQGWPLKAHCCKFDERTNVVKQQQLKQGEKSQNNILKFNSCEYLEKGKTRTHQSAVAFLLSTVSSKFCITLEMIFYERLTVVNFPINNLDNFNHVDSCLIMDPFSLPWRLFLNRSSRLVRVGLVPEQKPDLEHEPEYLKSSEKSSKIQSKQSHSERSTIPSGYLYLFGCKLRIQGYQSNGTNTRVIEPVGKEILQITCKKSDFYNELLLSNRLRHSGINVPQNNLNILLIKNLPKYLLKNNGAELLQSLCNTSVMDIDNKISKRLLRKASQISSVQVAMEITCQELTGSNMGILNPKTGTITIEIQWLYRHQIYIDTLYQTDEIGARQYHQMRNELIKITKEKDELERQLMGYRMGLVQIDSRSHGPKSMLPLEFIPGLVDHSTTTTVPSGEDWHNSSCYSEKAVLQQPCYRMNNTVSSLKYKCNNQHTKSHATSSPSNYSSDKLKACKPYGLLSTCHIENNMSHSLLDYESSDESAPRSSYPIYRPTSKQPMSSKCGLSEKRKQFIYSKGSWKTCETVKYCPDSDINSVHSRRFNARKPSLNKYCSQGFVEANFSPLYTSESSTSNVFNSRSEDEFSFIF